MEQESGTGKSGVSCAADNTSHLGHVSSATPNPQKLCVEAGWVILASLVIVEPKRFQKEAV